MGDGTHPVILHISDLHFGWEKSEQSISNRHQVLGNQGLLRELQRLEPEWMPDYVCVTGDIGGRGEASDYVIAQDWLQDLLKTLGLSVESLVVCPGNHDSCRDIAIRYTRPLDGEKCDQVLRYPVLPDAQYLTMPFREFSTFCSNFRIRPVRIGDWDNYLVGTRNSSDHFNVQFICLNSAWFSMGSDDERNLWLGLELIKFLEDEDRLPHHDSLSDSSLTVVLMHHPDDWLHDHERRQVNGRHNTINYLYDRCHILLTGHTHGEPRKPDLRNCRTIHFQGGPGYENCRHPNSFRLIRIEPERVHYRVYEYPPGSSDSAWILKMQDAILHPNYIARILQQSEYRSDESPVVSVDISKISRSANDHLQRLRDATDKPDWHLAFRFAAEVDAWIESIDTVVMELLPPQLCVDLYLLLSEVEFEKERRELPHDLARARQHLTSAEYHLGRTKHA